MSEMAGIVTPNRFLTISAAPQSALTALPCPCRLNRNAPALKPSYLEYFSSGLDR
jgi:hypothetical protein